MDVTFLETELVFVSVSCTGVDCLGGDGGVEGRFLSAEMALLGTFWQEGVEGRVTVGEGQRRGPGGATGVGDMYRELISLVLDLRVVSLFLSDRTEGGREVSTAEFFISVAFDL